jgi:hypothetical protein
MKETKSSNSLTQNVVSSFIDKPSTSAQIKKPKKTTKSKDKTAGKTSQSRDIRKVMRKQEDDLNNFGTPDEQDPFEKDLALAMKESLKEFNAIKKKNNAVQEKLSKFENPFATAKIQNTANVKKRVTLLSDLGNIAKKGKRNKFSHLPAVLAKTSDSARSEKIALKINQVLNYDFQSDTNDNASDGEGADEKEVHSYYLKELKQTNGIFSVDKIDKNCSEVLFEYYVGSLFEPSYTKTDHLMRSWSEIVGRDFSPVKENENKPISTPEKVNVENDEGGGDVQMECDDASCSDIFEGIETFTIDDSNNDNQDISLKSDNEQNKSTIEKNKDNEEAMIDLTQVEASDSDTTIHYSPKVANNSQISHNSSHNVDDDDVDEESNEVICISDEEINYCNHNDKSGNDSDNDCDEAENNETDAKSEPEIIEIDNLNENSWTDMISFQLDKNEHFENDVSMALDNVEIIDHNCTKSSTTTTANSNSKLSKVIDSQGGSISLVNKTNINSKNSYDEEEQPTWRNDLVQYDDYEPLEDNMIDLTQCELFQDNNKENNGSQEHGDEKDDDFDNVLELNESINRSIKHILNTPKISAKRKSRGTRKKSLGIQIDDKYLVDTQTNYVLPDYTKMRPDELKRELLKYGIRPLPIKKAIEFLEYIYKQTHPEIRVASNEEICADNTKVNDTDIISNIAMSDENDAFVFQLDNDEEDIILPKAKKSKVSCFLNYLFIYLFVCLFYRHQELTLLWETERRREGGMERVYR